MDDPRQRDSNLSGPATSPAAPSSEAGGQARPAPDAPESGAGPQARRDVPGEVAAHGPTPVRAPMPELPKGGGAIRPIGDTFKANPATGTGGMAIPIQAPAGRGGFGPQLALSYDSGAGNGPFGVGWELSVPAITRKTDQRLPEYDDRAETDSFILSGAEELVPALVWNETESTWKRDESETATERRLRFRPRIEGLFARIERITHKATGDTYWEATRRDNVKSTYGTSAASRIVDPRFPLRVFSWLLEKTEDDRGNIIRYSYKAEDKTGAPLLACEAHRQDGASATFTNRYLKRIEYANTTPFVASAFLFELVFDYGEHDAEAPTPVEDTPWAAREDPFSTYKPGFEVRTYRLCRRVLAFHRFEELEASAAPRLVSSTDLTYDENPILTKLTAITVAGYDRPLGTYVKKSFPPTELTYSPADIHLGPCKYFDKESHPISPWSRSERRYQWVDLDGEGIPGILSRTAGAFYYKRNLGDARLHGLQKLRVTPSSATLPA